MRKLTITFVGLFSFLLLAASCAPKADVGSLPCKIVLRGEADEVAPELVARGDGAIYFTVPVGCIPKGGVVDFNANLQTTATCSTYYTLEMQSGDSWLPGGMYMCNKQPKWPEEHPTTVMHTFRTPKAIRDSIVFRLKPVAEDSDSLANDGGPAQMYLSHYGYVGEYVQYFGTAVPKDTSDVLCIGNSFTYYNGTPYMLKEIAWNEGHLLRVTASLKGGRTFGQHLALPISRFTVNRGGYDFAFLQDQSQNVAKFASDTSKYAQVNKDFQELLDKVYARSPKCCVMLEGTWAYKNNDFGGFGSYEAFDSLMLAGAVDMARMANEKNSDYQVAASLIGQAFKMVREGDSGIELSWKDNHHQSEYGSYLKACVNYLMMFGEPFHSEPQDGAVSSVDCGLPHDVAQYLRGIAEQVVLK